MQDIHLLPATKNRNDLPSIQERFHAQLHIHHRAREPEPTILEVSKGELSAGGEVDRTEDGD